MFISEEEKKTIIDGLANLEISQIEDRAKLHMAIGEISDIKHRVLNGELKDPEIHLLDMIRAIAEHIGIEFTTVQVPDPMRPPEPPATISKLVAVKKAKPKGKK